MAGHFEDFFSEADKDGNGSLTMQELSHVLKCQCYTESDTSIFFKSMDTDADKKVTLEEFLMAMGQIPEPNHKASAFRRVFNEFDKDGSGEIDRSELDAVFDEMGKHFSEDELKRMIKQADDDQSGTINCKEFCRNIFGYEG